MTIYKGQNNMKLSHITLMMKPHNISAVTFLFPSSPTPTMNFVLFLCASCVCLSRCFCWMLWLGYTEGNWEMVVCLTELNWLERDTMLLFRTSGKDVCENIHLSNEEIVGKFLWSFNDRSFHSLVECFSFRVFLHL